MSFLQQMRIFLVRHGQTQWNVENRLQGNRGVPLNSVGQQQVEDAAQKCAHLPITAIYSSPALHAKQIENAEIVEIECDGNKARIVG